MVSTRAELSEARRLYEEQRWEAAHEALMAADRAQPLEAGDLERLATTAYMLGREAEYLETLERAHRAHLDSGGPLDALRCAFWIGINLARRGEAGRAGGWLGRAERLLERVGGDRVERGYLLLPEVFREEAGGNWGAAAALALEIVELAERFGDADLFALAAHEQGHALIRAGRTRAGLALLDETMVAVTAGELSPIVSGIAYCGVILACQDAFEVRRASEWTAALSRWCERQPDLVAFTGRCLVHRAEILQLHGSWDDALAEARRAARRCIEGENPAAAGEAAYREGEILRLLGELGAAEEAYREASRLGREPQPGLSLLRLAQGRKEAAVTAIRRLAAEVADITRRAAILPAFVEIMLAAGDLDAARGACDELDSLAAGHEGGLVEAMAFQSRGAVRLASGEAESSLPALRRAGELWRSIGAPYEAARARELLGLACRALGDEEAAELELTAAGGAYAELGASADRARVEGSGRDGHPLTARELEVLRHLALGVTNKAIAAELVLSERTVERHVSNIFAKLGVSSRAAATAHAYEHRLL